MIESLTVDKNTTLKKTMKIMDTGGLGLAFVTDKNKFVGLVEDSDIRRALLTGVNLSQSIISITNRTPVTVGKNWGKKEVNTLLLNNDIKFLFPDYGTIKIPVVDKDKVIDIVFLSRKGYEGRLNAGFEFKKVKRVLVVGGAGYLGSILCKKLLDSYYTVRILDNLMYGYDGLKPIFHYPNLEFMYGDIRDLNVVGKAIKDVDAVVHLAAIVGDPASALNPEETVQSNYLAARMLAEVCKHSQVNRFIFASTCSVYGANKPGKQLTESSKLNPVSLYAKMKLESEKAILEMEDDNFAPTVFRMGTLYGKSPRMRFDLVVNTLSILAAKNGEFSVFGGNQYRALCHVNDAAQAYKLCLESPVKNVKGITFNITSENIKIIDVGRAVKNQFPNSTMHVDTKKVDERNYSVLSDKAKQTINFCPKHTITDGIREIYQSVEEYIDYPNTKYSNYDYLKGD